MTNSAQNVANEEGVDISFEINVRVPFAWIDSVVLGSSVFEPNCCGSWLRSVEHSAERGWLAWECHGKDAAKGEEPGRHEALLAWARDEPLPPRWFRLNQATAIAAYREGVKMWGIEWYSEYLTQDEIVDAVLQRVLLSPAERAWRWPF